MANISAARQSKLMKQQRTDEPSKPVLDIRINETNCPTRFTVHLLRGKWKTVILYYLKEGPLHFGELRRFVPRASHKVLVQQLRELERDHLIRRRRIEGNVKRTEYSFSEHGKTFAPVLEALAIWGSAYRIQSGEPTRRSGDAPPEQPRLAR